MNSCPGWYCGRQYLQNGDLSDCGSCPRGYRRNDTTFICGLCTSIPTFYDWLFLGFIALSVLVLHWFFIDMVAMRRTLIFSKDVLILHLTAFIEVLLSSISSIILIHPFGEFQIYSCPVRGLADWYTLLHNPTPNYEQKIHCTQEAVYPLYTLVFIFYALTLTIMLLLRPWVCRRFLPRQSKMSIYAAMYFIPILAVIHAVIGGLLYYAFPVLIIILSVISCAAHFAVKIDQSITGLILSTITDARNIVILLGHWALHAYGIISITQLDFTLHSLLLLLLVPVPALFYIFTSKFTDPRKF